MQRLGAKEFLAEVLADTDAPVNDLPTALQDRLLEVAQMDPGVRVEQLESAFLAEASRG